MSVLVAEPRAPGATDGALAPAPRVRVEQLSAWFGSRRVVHDVSIDCPSGGVTAIIGPSGCGKSTVLRCVNRLHETVPGARTSGRILLDHADVYDERVNPVSIRRRIGMVFQRATPFPHWSIRENVLAAARAAGGTHDIIVEQALERAALWREVKDRLHHPATALSIGQQQRLCVARALAARPDVLLLDEPTAALDPISTQRIEELVYELRGALTVVIVTHNMQQAARVSDQTVFMLAGDVIEADATDTLVTRPRDPRTEAYITGRFG